MKVLLSLHSMQADIDGNGTLDCKEFVTVSIHLKKIRSEDHLPKVFSYFDKNGSGFIEMEELKEALSPRGDQKAIDDIIFDVDKDKVKPPSIHPSIHHKQELANHFSRSIPLALY